MIRLAFGLYTWDSLADLFRVVREEKHFRDFRDYPNDWVMSPSIASSRSIQVPIKPFAMAPSGIAVGQVQPFVSHFAACGKSPGHCSAASGTVSALQKHCEMGFQTVENCRRDFPPEERSVTIHTWDEMGPDDLRAAKVAIEYEPMK